MRKICLTLVLVICLSVFSIPAFAANIESEIDTQGEYAARAVETEWYYRIYNGRLQQRLWSITDQKWLTDWEYV